ncbi:MAG: hypothetical protein GY762_16290 [Proteobacteria bacterium]|nr:hypothetical protein [Pseudomonadota bacterium]
MSSITFITPELARLENVSARVLVLYRFAEMKPLQGMASLVDWRLYGHLSKLVINGFLKGEGEESLLMPLGRLLPQQYLLVFGLGERAEFTKKSFFTSAKRTFETIRKLGHRDMVLTLPGRVEKACTSSDSIGWFLSCYEEHGDAQNIQIVEPTGSQKAMLPLVERWRLKQLVP